jgi:hypothetical protein
MPNQWFANLETDMRSTLLDFAERALLHHTGNVERAAQDCHTKFALELAHARFAVRFVETGSGLRVTPLCSLWLSMFALTSASSW